MEVSADALSMHRLVQAVVRDRLDDEAKKQWAGATVEVVNASLSTDVATNVEIWPCYGRLLPLALAVAGHAEDLQVALPAAARVSEPSWCLFKHPRRICAGQKSL